VIVEITRNRLGTAAVLNEQEQILGIVTDGDIRRMLEKYNNFSDLKAGDIMGKNPRSINADAMAVEALETMRKNNISQLLVIDNNRYAGVVHLHDLVREGII
jgi:arabinose-5-phosphate isomerase